MIRWCHKNYHNSKNKNWKNLKFGFSFYSADLPIHLNLKNISIFLNKIHDGDHADQNPIFFFKGGQIYIKDLESFE